MADQAPAAPPPPASPEAVTLPTPAGEKQSIGKILRDFGKGTKDLMRFVFMENRAERRRELVESLRFYVTYKWIITFQQL